MENSMRSLKKLKIKLPHDPAIPLLGMYPKEFKAGSWRDIYTPKFISVSFTIAKRWKHPKCWSTDEWIKKMWYIHTMECYAALKKKKNPVTCINMDELQGHYANQNKPVTKGQILYKCVHMKHLK